MKMKKVLATITICSVLSTMQTIEVNATTSAGAGSIIAADVDNINKDDNDINNAECCVKISEEQNLDKKEESVEVDLSDFQDTLKTRNDIVIQYTNKIGPMYDIDPLLLQAMIFIESSNNPKAVNGRCCGYMQVNDKWHWDRMERLGVTDVYDGYGNILVGTDYLSELMKKHNGDISLSLAIYNGDSNAYYLHSIGEQSNYAKRITNLQYRLTLLEELLHSANN